MDIQYQGGAEKQALLRIYFWLVPNPTTGCARRGIGYRKRVTSKDVKDAGVLPRDTFALAQSFCPTG